jgi:hypothetical protein
MDWLYQAIYNLIDGLNWVAGRLDELWNNVRYWLNDLEARVNIAAHRLAEELYIAIRDWAYGVFVTAASVIRWMEDQIRIATDYIFTTVNRTWDTIVEDIARWVRGAFATIDYVGGLIDRAIDRAVEIIRELIVPWIEGVRREVEEWARGMFAPLDSVLPWDVRDTIQAVREVLESVLTFFRDPTGVIFDLIILYLLDWFCGVLAHGVDTSVPLPKRPLPREGR